LAFLISEIRPIRGYNKKRDLETPKSNELGKTAFAPEPAIARRSRVLLLNRCFRALPAPRNQPKTAKREKRQRTRFGDLTSGDVITEVGPRSKTT
jgi:hypothetical protein